MPLLKFLGSLKLTVTLLAFAFALVFFATLDQVRYGIAHAQELYFESFALLCPVVSLLQTLLVGTWDPKWEFLRLPLLGGSSLGLLFALNLIVAHVFHFRGKLRFTGILILHFGLLLLIISGFLAKMTRWEGQMRLEENGAALYHATSYNQYEVVFINEAEKDFDKVVAIDESLLKKAWKKKEGVVIEALKLRLIPHLLLEHAGVGDRARLLSQYRNLKDKRQVAWADSFIQNLENPNVVAMDTWGKALFFKQGHKWKGLATSRDLVLQQRPKTWKEDEANLPALILEARNLEGQSLGIWLLSAGLADTISAQTLTSDKRVYKIALRFRRFYQPFGLQLVDFQKEDYPNSRVPKKFLSHVRLLTEGKALPASIEMNEPLRWKGLTFYQSGFEEDESTSILQVVKNPSWALPRVAITLVLLGLAWQFGFSLLRFQQGQFKEKNR